MHSNFFIQQAQEQAQQQQPQIQPKSPARGRGRQFPQPSYFNTQPTQPQQQLQQQPQLQQQQQQYQQQYQQQQPQYQDNVQQAPQEPPKPKRKIDPSQMPNPATILSGPQVSKVERYVTKPEPLPVAEPLIQPGFGLYGAPMPVAGVQEEQGSDSLAVPPPVNKPNVQVVDSGNCNPKFMRMSMYSWPQSKDMLGNVGLPLGAIISPLADVDQSNADECVYLVSNEENGGAPIRCKRCGAYISPMVKFDSTGRNYKCVICDADNEIPDWYYSPIDPNGKRADIISRPELTRGTIEFSVTNDLYYTNKKAPRAGGLCFVIDISDRSIANGALALITATLKQFLTTGIFAGTPLCIITYNTIAHFWDLSGTKPRMLAAPDYGEPFSPMHSGAFTPATEEGGGAPALTALLDALPDIAAKQSPRERSGDSGLGSALKAARALFEGQDKLGGRILLFHASLPVAAPATATLRDNYTLYGTDKERTLYQPQAPFYAEFGKRLAGSRVGLDAFLFSKEYIDVASVGEICRATGGQVYFYHHFEAARDAWKFDADIRRNVTRAWGYDASLRVRVSRGVSIAGYTGHFTPSNYADDIDIAAIDADKAIAVNFTYDESAMKEGSKIAVQCALLYTTAAGERRVRVHNILVPVSGQYSTVFKAIDCDAVVSLLTRDAAEAARVRGHQLNTIVSNAFERIADSLAAYRRLCTKNPASGQLILPESVRLLPLYMNALSKSPLLRREVRPDMRCTAFHQALSESAERIALRLYPRAFDVDDVLAAEEEDFPQATRLGSEFVAADGAYIVDDGAAVYVWLGKSPSPEAFARVFGGVGVVSETAPQTELTQAFSAALASGSQEMARIAKLIQFFATQRMHNCFSINVLREADVSNYNFLWAFLIEDAQAGNLSYVDYLCALHKKIQQKIINMENQNASIMAMAFSHI